MGISKPPNMENKQTTFLGNLTKTNFKKTWNNVRCLIILKIKCYVLRKKAKHFNLRIFC